MDLISSTAQILSISISLIASGGIAALSLFDVPELQAQPASRSLPSARWLFSRGSHIFPTAAVISSTGFVYLAYSALPSGPRIFAQVMSSAASGATSRGYLSAAALVLSIAPFTAIMIPTNFAIIKMNEVKGGSRSEKSAKQTGQHGAGKRSAEDSVNGEGEAEEFTDMSGPQTQTSRKSTKDEDEKVIKLLAKFSTLNFARAVLIGTGGMVGLWTTLAT
jgi:hypothetical protein